MTAMVQDNVIQGSDEWLELRLKRFNASEAPVIMSSHPNMTRNELLEAKATCNPKEFSSFVVEKIFAKGHETEAAARAILEDQINDDLWPVSGSNGKYAASFDGLTFAFDTGFEHKQWNAEVAPKIEAGDIPECLYWQLEHQFIANPGLVEIYLVMSDGTTNNWVQQIYRPVPGRRAQLIAAWEQFEKDVAEFVPTEKTVQAVGIKPESLPVINVEIQGELATIDNIKEFRAAAQSLIGSIKTTLTTDQDFADAEAAVKWLAEGEKKIDLIKGQIAAKAKLEDLINTLDDIQQNMMRATRLKLNKQVEAQKTNRRNEIVQDAKAELQEFVQGVTAEFAGSGVTIIPLAPVDFYSVIKGKRSFDNMVSACDDAIAQAKITINENAAKIRKNLALLEKHNEFSFLFSDKNTLVAMEFDHLKLKVDSLIREYKDKQAQDEEARKKRHSDVIARIVSAGQFDESIPLNALVETRERIKAVNTDSMEEFSETAAQKKAATIKLLSDRIDLLRFEQEKAAEARKKQAEDVAKPATAPVQSNNVKPADPAIHEPVRSVATVLGMDLPVRPSDKQLVIAIAKAFSVGCETALEWLCEFEGDALDGTDFDF